MAQDTRKRLVGIITSDKMNKTVVVQVTTQKQHPLYGKMMRYTKKFKAHDEENECNEGDRVRIVESRPLSRDKRWVVQEILERAQ